MKTKTLLKKTGLTLLLAVFSYLFFIQCKKEAYNEATPSIVQLSESQATIAWESNISYTGKVYYKITGADTDPMIATDKLGKAIKHEVELVGLLASAQYTYWIEGMEKNYQFQTKPLQNSSFSFLITSGSGKDNYLSILQQEACSFILNFNNIISSELKECSPYAPIINVDSLTHTLDWGGLHLEIIRNENHLLDGFNTSGSHTLGILIYPSLVDSTNIANSQLHKMLVEHNSQESNTQASFVGLINSNLPVQNIDGICYFGLAQGINSNPGNFSLIVNIDTESTSAYFITENKEIMLKAPPLQSKRTCKDCRRLAERGAYAESIIAYKQFIADNKGHYQIDDAYFAIAELYDAKLFQYQQALEWYHLLFQDFPASNLLALANQRLIYISTYNDFDYKPLAAFENIKNYEFAKANNSPAKQTEVLEKLDEVIKQYPESELAPTMLLWMANQYQLINVSKAVAIYNRILSTYPDFSKLNEVSVKIGETYYNNAQWDSASTMYTKAISEYPNLKETIDSQLARVYRNIWRIQLHYISLIILISFIFILFFTQPYGFIHPGWKKLFIAMVLNAIIMSLYCWMYREEFSLPKEIFLLVSAFSVSILLAILTAYTFTRKFLPKQKLIAIIIGNILGLVVLASGFYQSIYHLYVHYLAALGL